MSRPFRSVGGTRGLIQRYIGFGLAALAVAFVAHSEAIGDASARYSFGVILALVSIPLLIRGRQPHSPRPATRPADGVAFAISDRDLDEKIATERSLLLLSLSPAEINVATKLLLDPPQGLQRVVESYTLRDGYLVQHVSREVVLPRVDIEIPVGPLAYCIPIMRPFKGELIDTLDVFDGSGAALPTLSQEESRGILYLAVEQALRRHKRIGPNDPLSKRRRAELSAQLRAVCREGALPTRGSNAEASSSPRTVTGVNRTLFDSIVEGTATSYVIFAVVLGRPGDRVIVKTDRAMAGRLGRRTIRERARYFLGVRPHKIEIPIHHSAETLSHHFRFVCPSEQYVHYADLTAAGESSLMTNALPVPMKDYGARIVTGNDPNGGIFDYAHFYIRGGANMPSVGLVARLDIRERPPGLLGIVAFVAAAQTTLIWLLGVFHTFFFPIVRGEHSQFAHHALNPSSQSLATDLPALLLATSGLMAGWLASQFTAERLQRTSLATVIGTMLVGALALVTTALAVLKQVWAIDNDIDRSVGGIHIHIEHPTWLALMLFSAAFTTDLFLRYFCRSREFERRANSVTQMARRLI